MAVCFVAMGSNIDRDQHMPAVLNTLRYHFGTLTLSSIYESPAMGFHGAPFYNAVVCFDSAYSAEDTARLLRQIEYAHGRPELSQKLSSRTIDLDLLLYADLIIQTDVLQLPRLDIERYSFVLEPLAELAPNDVHPILQQTYHQLWLSLDASHPQTRVKPDWLSLLHPDILIS